MLPFMFFFFYHSLFFMYNFCFHDVSHIRDVPPHDLIVLLAGIIVYTVKVFAGGARGVMVIIVSNGHGDMSLNPGQDWLHFT